MEYVIADTVPETCLHITAGKEYAFQRTTMEIGVITIDNGCDILIRPAACAFLAGGAWRVANDNNIMVPGMGAHGVPVANESPAPDVRPGLGGMTGDQWESAQLARRVGGGILAGLYARNALDDVSPTRRKGDFVQTFTGRKFWPLDPRADELNIVDIAHSLSMQCRYAGHCERFYSVAEHCVLIARHLSCKHGSKRMALSGLLHDASEAYLVDLPRPVKNNMPDYRRYEDALLAVIADKYGLTFDSYVHEADSCIMADEIEQNMRPMDWHEDHIAPLGVTLRFWSPAEAEREFLIAFREFGGLS